MCEFCGEKDCKGCMSLFIAPPPDLEINPEEVEKEPFQPFTKEELALIYVALDRQSNADEERGNMEGMWECEHLKRKVFAAVEKK